MARKTDAGQSAIGTLPNGRVVPNPNVLIELGYAMAALGSDRLILVLNTYYGSIADLPFDIKHRRVAPYSLGPEEAKNKGASKILSGAFAAALGNWLRDVGAKAAVHLRPSVWETPTIQADAATHALIHQQDDVPFIDLTVRPSRTFQFPQDEKIREKIYNNGCNNFPMALIPMGANGGRWGVRPKVDSIQMDEGEEVDFEFWRLYLNGDFHSVRRVQSNAGELNLSYFLSSIIQMYSFLPAFYRSVGLRDDEGLTVRWRVSGLKGRTLVSDDPRDRAEFRFAPKTAVEHQTDVVQTFTIDEFDKNAAAKIISLVNDILVYFNYYKLSTAWPELIAKSVRRYNLNLPEPQ